MATAKGKITAANATRGTIVRIVVGELKFPYPARIKRGSVLAEILDNVSMGGGQRKIVTKFGDLTVVGHQTFILAKDGETAEEPTPEPETFDALAHVSNQEMPVIETIPSFENGPAGIGCFPPVEEIAEAEETIAAFLEAAPEFHISPEEIPAEVLEAVRTMEGAPVIEAKRVPAATFSLSEQEIAENAAVKLADTIRRDEEMYAEKVAEDTVSWMEERKAHLEAEAARINAEALQACVDAEENIRTLALPTVDAEKARFDLETARMFVKNGDPIEGKRMAKRTAEMWARVQRLRGEFEAAPEWRKERITAALATMGTVVYPEGTPEYTRYREELTEALTAFAAGPVRWRVTFERVGRFSPGVVPAFEYNTTETMDSVEARLRSHLRRYLTSKEFAITFEGERLLIEGGRFGSGTASIIP